MNLIRSGWLVLLLLSCAASPSFARDERPNVLVIVSDDQAWTDYGFMGHPEIRTPHLDKLANRSLVFGRGYVASPLCRPSLASMVTGLHPTRHGITGNDVDGPNQRARRDIPVRAAFHRHPSFIRLLTSNGYLAHQSGKWWEGSAKDGGFTHGMTHGDPERGGRHGDAGLRIGRDGLKPVTDFIDLAVAREKPFLVWYAPFLPHTPHNPPARLLEKHAQPGRPADVAKYHAMCEWFDETCGELFDHLARKKLTARTMIIYICDNGWAARSTNADDPNQQQWSTYALRSKGSPYENGIRTPIMVSWPGRVTPERSTDLAHAIDLFPTIAKSAGLPVPAKLQGLNLLDEDARQDRKVVFGVTHSIYNMTPGNPDDTLQYLWAVDGDWKLILRRDGKDTTRYRNVHRWDTARERLYHLKDDPHERHDLASSRPEIVARLKDRIEAWHAEQRSP